MQDRFAKARVARLATITSDLRAHVVPCCFATLGDAVVTAVDGKPKSTLSLRRLDNITAHPHVSLVVDHYNDDWNQLWWIRVDGLATILQGGPAYEAAVDALAAKYPQYVADRPQGAVVRITNLSWRSWGLPE